MKEYPSIPRDIVRDCNVYAFDKLDGSNIRAEWSRKRGFYKFGTRHQMLGIDNPVFGEAIPLIQTNYEPQLNEIFKYKRYDGVVCYFEFYGPSSFAGQHVKEPHQVTLFDVDISRKGILEPKEFVNDYGHLGIPKMLYHGKADGDLIDAIKQSQLDGMTFEGVVCKARAPGGKQYTPPIMFKIKSLAWLNKLKAYCAGDEKKFNELQ